MIILEFISSHSANIRECFFQILKYQCTNIDFLCIWVYMCYLFVDAVVVIVLNLPLPGGRRQHG